MNFGLGLYSCTSVDDSTAMTLLKLVQSWKDAIRHRENAVTSSAILTINQFLVVGL